MAYEVTLASSKEGSKAREIDQTERLLSEEKGVHYKAAHQKMTAQQALEVKKGESREWKRAV